MEQQLEALGVVALEGQIMHRTVLQHQSGAAVDAGQMVLVPLHRGVERFTAGQMTGADQAALLQLAQMAIDRRQSHGLGALAQQGVEVLTGELTIRLSELRQQLLLSIARGGNLG
jgi:hypothetical protein